MKIEIFHNPIIRCKMVCLLTIVITAQCGLIDPVDPVDANSVTVQQQAKAVGSNSAICQPLEEYYMKTLWKPIFEPQCFVCHNQEGQAASSRLVWKPQNTLADYIDNIYMLKNVSRDMKRNISIMLLKPSEKIIHSGGKQFAEDSDSYKAVLGFVNRLVRPMDCESQLKAESLEKQEATCENLNTEYKGAIWEPIISKKCIACHNINGIGNASSFVLTSTSEENHLETNFNVVRDVLLDKRGELSIALTKPTNTVAHQGGTIFAKDSDDYRGFERMISLFEQLPNCQFIP